MSYTRAYHYTRFASATGIVQGDAIRRSTSYNNEIAAVWFSTNPTYEPGAGMHTKNGKDSREVSFEQLVTKIGLARFITDTSVLMPYPEAVASGLVEPCAAEFNAAYVSRYGGSTDDWLIHPHADFPLSLCTGAELYLEGEWVEMTPEGMAALSATLPRVIGATWGDVFGHKRRRVPKKRKRRK